MTPEEFRDHQNVKIWNIFLILVFLGTGVWMVRYIKTHIGFPTSVSVFDFFILALATFRLIRLVSYDSIFGFVHELFMRKQITPTSSGGQSIAYVQESKGLKRAISILLGCLWCTGVWISLFATFIYFAFPASWIVFFALAIAGLAGIFQLIANAVGWVAEHKKAVVQKGNGEDGSLAIRGL